MVDEHLLWMVRIIRKSDGRIMHEWALSEKDAKHFAHAIEQSLDDENYRYELEPPEAVDGGPPGP